MKVILNSDVEELGRKGDVVEVAPGYARNFLLPRNIAIAATKGALQQAEAMRNAREQHDRQELEEAQAIATKIAKATLVVRARAGDEGALFGSVTSADIADVIKETTGLEFDRKVIQVTDPIRSVGAHGFQVHLHPEVNAEGTVQVVAGS
jgi:large subunit ribosomal protein L9